MTHAIAEIIEKILQFLFHHPVLVAQGSRLQVDNRIAFFIVIALILIAYMLVIRKANQARALPVFLRFACDGRLAAISDLLDSGHDIDETDTKGNTALMFACLNNGVGVVQLLLERGANVILKNSGGATALDIARKKKFDEIARLIEEKTEGVGSN